MSSLPWRDLLGLVVSTKSRKCPLRLLDTIFLDEALAPAWYFTTKAGVVSRKKGDNSHISNVADRFRRFALANPSNTEGYVGVLVDGASGRRRELSDEALRTLLDGQEPDALKLLTRPGSQHYLQVYLRPKQGVARFLSVRYAPVESEPVTFSERSMRDGSTSSSDDSDFTRGQVQGFSGEVIDYLRDAANLTVEGMTMDFVIDDNEHAWLSGVSSLGVSSIGDDGSNQGGPAKSPRSPRSLPQLKKVPPNMEQQQQQQQQIASSGDAKTSATEAASSSSSSGGGGLSSRSGSASRPAPAGRNGGAVTQSMETLGGLGSGSELISKEGGVYRASLGPDELPGLRAWSLASLSDNDRMGWAVDLEEYSSLPSPTANLGELRKRRATTRMVATYRFVAFSRHAEKLLLGQEVVDSDADFVALWKQALLKTSASDPAGGRLQSEVTVDGNLFGICRKLEALTESNFKATATLPPRDVPTLSNLALNGRGDGSPGGGGGGVRPMSGPGQMDRPGSRGGVASPGGMRTASAGSNMDPFEDGGLLSSLAAADRAQAALTGEAMGMAPSKKGGKKIKKKKTPFEQAMLADPVPDGSKPLKRFGKNMDLDAPPNMEMMAKFAAEKEKLMRAGSGDAAPVLKGGKAKKKKAKKDEESDFAMMGGGLEDSGEMEDFLKHGKKKKKTTRGYDPRQDEARLAELELLAQQAKEQFHKGAPMNGAPLHGHGLAQGSVGSLAAGSMMSEVEADFMYRQAAGSQDLGQLSSLAFDDGGSPPGRSGAGRLGKSKSSLQDGINSTLQERVEALEKQNSNLTQILTKRNMELEASEIKTRDMRALLESQRLAAANQLLRIEEQHRKEFLGLKESHSSEMAAILAPAEEEEEEVSPSMEPRSPKMSKADAKHAAQQLLMNQIEKLRSENKRIIEEYAVERRALSDDLKGKAMILESSLRSEVSELRARAVNLEDDLTGSRDDCVAARAKVDNISRLCKQLELDRKEAIDNQDKLRADLANMQQSVAASYRLESEQGINVGVDADTAIKMHEAKSEAKERQLSNKVEFLKAQLSAEQATTEELKQGKNDVRFEMEEMKEESKKRFKELEKTKQDAIAETERQVEQRYEERMSELTTLQAKMSLLNAQLQDAFQEGSLSKAREDAAKGATAKALAHQAAIKNEADGLRKQVEELRDKQDELMGRESGRQNSEAMLRRLDNERQYLKSQLASEITHKNELQGTLNNVQAQLADVNRQWKVDVETLRNKQTQQVNTTTQNTQRTMQTTLHLESEVERLSKANTDLKEGFTKTRDLLRAEQLTMENMKSSGKRMLEELEQSREDVIRLRQEIEDDGEIHQKQREALNEGLREMDARRLAETKNLREEISRGYAQLSEAQKEAMVLSDRLNGEKGRQSSMLHAARVFEVLHRWRRSRLYEYFRKWSVNSTLSEMATQFRDQVDAMVVNLNAEADEVRVHALEDQKTQLKETEEVRVEALHMDADKATHKVVRECEEDTRRRLEEMRAEFKKVLDEKDEQWAMEVDLAVRAGEDEAAKTMQRAEMKVVQMEERAAIEKSELEFAGRKALADAVSVANFSKDEEWAAKLMEREAALVAVKEELAKLITQEGAARMQEALAALAAEHEAALKEKDEERASVLRSATDAADNALSLLKTRMITEHVKQAEDLNDDHSDALRALRQEMHEHAEERMRGLREAWVEEKEAEILAKEEDFEDQMESRMAEQGKVHERDMAGVVKLEAAKWQQALREAEKRFRLEAKQAHGEGWAARDRDARTEIQQVTSEHLMKANQVAEMHKEAVNEVARVHTGAMTDLHTKMEAEQKKDVLRTERETRHVVETEWAEKMKHRIDEVYAETADMWQDKMKRETDKLESFKEDVAKDRQRQAEERSELMSRVAQSDELLKSIEDLNETEVRKMKEEHTKALNALTAKLEKMKSSTVKDIEGKAAEQMEQAELAFRQEMASMLKLERDRTTDNMEAQMKDMQDESTKMIVRLEKAVMGLKDEKTKLQGELSDLTVKCEDTEDALYDAQKEQKQKDKANSLAIWKSMTNMATMRLRFQAGMENFDKEAAATLEKVQRKAMSKVDQMTLTAMQYCGTMVNVEKVRGRLHDTLVNYKQETLIEKRTQIKMLERDLDKLTQERDSLEDTRETMDEETAGLEAQVRELEEQIRDHNRSSSMTNGRINVAHARKKRRLDSELERILELIEQRRIQIGELDDKVAERGRARDEKESRMIDLEKDLVGVLLEQQKKVLSLVEEASFEAKNRELALVAGFHWPPAKANPTMADVKALKRERQAEKEEADKEKEDGGDAQDSGDDDAN